MVVFVFLMRFLPQHYKCPVSDRLNFRCDHLSRKIRRDDQLESVYDGHMAILYQEYITNVLLKYIFISYLI